MKEFDACGKIGHFRSICKSSGETSSRSDSRPRQQGQGRHHPQSKAKDRRRHTAQCVDTEVSSVVIATIHNQTSERVKQDIESTSVFASSAALTL